MRSSRIIFAGSLALLALVGLWLFGCSDDKPSSVVGTSVIHSEYETIQEIVDANVDSMLALFNTGLEIIDLGNNSETEISATDVLYSATRPDSVNVSGDWYLIYNTEGSLALGYSNVLLDSIRFIQNGMFLDTPQDADAMNIRHYWTLNSLDTTVNYANYDVHGNFDFYGVDQETVSVTGYNNLQVNLKETTNDLSVRHQFAVENTFSNLVIENVEGDYNFGCPLSGTITVVVEMTYQLAENVAEVTEWEFVYTFENGTAQVQVTLGSDRENYTCEFCQINQQ
ncbi:MAG: hypothetical protein ACOYVF_10515 [Candidatus Zixiibacteriota bacterium]